MPRPTTKAVLLTAADEQYGKLLKLIESMSDAEQNAEFIFEDRDKNVRDVLVHLFEWHVLLFDWVAANELGESRPFLPEPYNWKTYPQMNVEVIWKKAQAVPLLDAKAALDDSHAKVMNLIDRFTDEELFEKKHFTWTGTTNLASYCISASSSHYDWAMKKIKRQIKESK